MISTVNVSSARNRLAGLWFLVSGILFIVLFIQTLGGYYGDRVQEAWGWLLPLLLPTLSLIIGVFVADPLNKVLESARTSRFVYRLALCLSSVYLLALLVVALVGQLTKLAPLDLMKVSSLGLGPLGGLVTAAVGIFFVKKGK